MLDGKRILLIVSGGVAAYKSLILVRRLRERGAAVRAVLTAGGARVRDAAFARRAHRGQGVSGPVLAHRRERDGPYPPLPRGGPCRGRAGHGRPHGEDGGRARRRPRLDRAARHRQAGAGRAGDECRDVGPCRDAGEHGAAGAARRAAGRAGGGRPRLRRDRRRAHGGAGRDRHRHRERAGRPRLGRARGQARGGHQRPHLGADRPGALHRQPLLGQAGPCDRRRARPPRRGGGARHRPDA